MIRIGNDRTNVIKRHAEIGDTYLYFYDGKEHLVLRSYDMSVSLTDPNVSWKGPKHYGDPNDIQLVDIDIKIL
jgi:hypothetical protein